MPKIIYRGKTETTDNCPYINGNKPNGTWVKGYLYVDGCFCEIRDSINNITYEVDLATIGEFTGLIVANGEVFEGDLLQFGDYILEVFWNDECFQWQAKKIDSNYVTLYHRCPYHYNKDWTAIDLGEIAAEPILTGQMTTKIIGNVWDNPEILDKYKSKNVSQEFYF